MEEFQDAGPVHRETDCRSGRGGQVLPEERGLNFNPRSLLWPYEEKVSGGEDLHHPRPEKGLESRLRSADFWGGATKASFRASTSGCFDLQSRPLLFAKETKLVVTCHDVVR